MPTTARSTRSARPKRGAPTRKRSKKVVSLPEDSDHLDEPSASEGESDAYKQESEDDAIALDSDALDDDDEEEEPVAVKPGKRKRAASSSKRSPKKASPLKARRRGDDEEDEEDDDFDDLKEGQEVVGRVVQAPKTGRVPPGQISQNTFNFLSELKKPECNDREWFKLHEPVFRLAEKEWKDFIEKFTDLLVETDPQIPPLPPKDVIYRIYRDVRFSNDKTPYKTSFSGTFSRSGRKGMFAGFKPGGESLLAAGSWCPGKNELATIRTHIQHNSSRLRKIIASPKFVGYFGTARPHPKGKRQNIFGMEDELKVAPKGIDKNHKDIDLLKCRSFAVIHRFTDAQVLSPDFNEQVLKVIEVAKPFVYCLNDWMTVGLDEDTVEAEDEGGEEDGDEDE